MRIGLIVAVLGVVMLTVAPRISESQSVIKNYIGSAKLHKSCQTPALEMFCSGYITGVLDGSFNSYNDEKMHTEFLILGEWRACIPDHVTIAQLHDVVRNILKKDKRHVRGVIFVGEALSKIYACPK